MDRRQAIAEDLRALADDLKTLVQTATTDPKERKKKERRWGVLYSGVGIVTSIVARRLAVKAWGILTGETAPKTGGPPASSSKPEQERSPARPAA